jgi:hypothetical protein
MQGKIITQKITKRSFENVVKLRYLREAVTNHNFIPKEIKRRLNSGNAYYLQSRSFFPSRLLSNDIKIRIYKTIILAVVLYGRETWSLTLREEH